MPQMMPLREEERGERAADYVLKVTPKEAAKRIYTEGTPSSQELHQEASVLAHPGGVPGSGPGAAYIPGYHLFLTLRMDAHPLS